MQKTHIHYLEIMSDMYSTYKHMTQEDSLRTVVHGGYLFKVSNIRRFDTMPNFAGINKTFLIVVITIQIEWFFNRYHTSILHNVASTLFLVHLRGLLHLISPYTVFNANLRMFCFMISLTFGMYIAKENWNRISKRVWRKNYFSLRVNLKIKNVFD